MITISVCIPCMNRAYDLKVALPYIIEAANASPPIEIMILDYNSRDDLSEYIEQVREERLLSIDNTLRYAKYAGRDYYHMAHAWNLVVKSSTGEYICIMGTDIMPHEGYFVAARRLIADGCIWMRGRLLKGVLICQREEFITAGGYDERFEFYGPEDRELDERLTRRGEKFGLLPNLLRVIPTSKADKIANYRIASRFEMKKRMRRIYEENQRNEVLVANKGIEWGQWIL